MGARLAVFALAVGIAWLGSPGIARGQAAAQNVRVGYVPLAGDATLFFLAQQLGYFRDEGLTVQLLPFASGSQEVELLANGQLDASGAGLSAALYEKAAAGTGPRVVADLGHDPPGYGFVVLVVRADLVRSGRFKSLNDLKGMTIAVSTPGSSSWVILNRLEGMAGLRGTDVEVLPLPYARHVLALREKRVDAALIVEPGATQAVREGVAVRVIANDAVYPNEQIAALLYSQALVKDRPDVGRRFMRAYIRTVRYYNDALAGGRLAGPNAETVVGVIATANRLDDRDVIRAATPVWLDPDGRLNVASMRSDLAFYRSTGLVRAVVRADDCVDASFAAEAVKELGPYRPAPRPSL